jgi:trimeric autotransporter adhesin
MSQVSIIDIEGNNPTIPTLFEADVGFAIPIANTLEILGDTTPAGVVPVFTNGSGNTITTLVQFSQAIGATDATRVGLAAFDSGDFAVDANGFVTFTGLSEITFDADVGSATSVAGIVNVIGDGDITTSGAGNTLTINFNAVVGETITGNTGGALPPTGGNWNILTDNSTPVFAGSGSTLTLDFGLSNLNMGSSMSSLGAGVRNVGLGLNNLVSTIDGFDNVAIGVSAAANIENGYYNIAIGNNALLAITDSIENVAVGTSALQGMTASDGFNTCVGHSSLGSIASGIYNTALGYRAGGNLASSNSSNICIGNRAVNGDSNRIRIGNQGSGDDQQDECFIAGIVGVTNSNAQVVTVDSTTGQLGVSTTVSESFTTDSGTATPVLGVLQVLGGTGINTAGAGDTVTVNLDSPVIVANGGTGKTTLTPVNGLVIANSTLAVGVTNAGSNGQVVIAKTAGAPAFATITSTGSTIDFTLGANTLNMETAGTVATSYTTDSGSAVPSAGVLQVTGSHGLNTDGATNVVDVQIDNAITLGDLSAIGAGSSALTCTTGDITITAGNLNLPSTTSANVGVVEQNGNRFIFSYPDFRNTYVGVASGNFTQTGNSNTGIGNNALASLTNGSNNTCVGLGAGDSITSGSSNNAFGFGALATLSTGTLNTAMGHQALGANTASANTAFGYQCLNLNTSGVEQTGVGHLALSNATGSTNAAFGYISGRFLTTGTNNTLLGNGTLSNPNLTSCSYNVVIGSSSGTSYTSTESDNILISSTGTTGDNNTIRIGTQGTGNGQQDSCFIAGIVGVTVSNSVPVSIDTTTGQLGVSTASSQPCFLARLSSDQTNATGDATEVTVIYGTEVFDQGANFDPTTGVFTAPVTGKYQFNCTINITGLTASHTAGTSKFISSNRTVFFNGLNYGAVRNVSNTARFSGSIILDMDAADTCYISMTVSGGTKVVNIASAENVFSGALIC